MQSVPAFQETGQRLPSGPDEILPPTARRDGKGKGGKGGKGKKGKDEGRGERKGEKGKERKGDGRKGKASREQDALRMVKARTFQMLFEFRFGCTKKQRNQSFKKFQGFVLIPDFEGYKNRVWQQRQGGQRFRCFSFDEGWVHFVFCRRKVTLSVFWGEHGIVNVVVPAVVCKCIVLLSPLDL